MRLIYLFFVLLFTCCSNKTIKQPVISRPPPFWPPHEFMGPALQGPMISFEDSIMLESLLETKIKDEIVDR